MTSAEPRVSVVMPTHQAAELIGGTIRCVLDQTFSGFEIVVVDNGSTDGTDEVVAALGDPRIRYHWQEDSGLPANSRNVGVRLARGEYVAFLDADDVWRRGKLERVMALFDADSGLALVAHEMLITSEGRVVKERVVIADQERLAEQLLYVGSYISTSSVTARRDALLEAGLFDERPEYLTVEDYDLWLRLVERGCRIAFIPEALGEYVVYGGSMSAKRERHYDNLVHVLDAHFAIAARAGRLQTSRALGRVLRSQAGLVRALGADGAWGRAGARALRLVPFALGESARYLRLGRESARAARHPSGRSDP